MFTMGKISVSKKVGSKVKEEELKSLLKTYEEIANREKSANEHFEMFFYNKDVFVLHIKTTKYKTKEGVKTNVVTGEEYLKKEIESCLNKFNFSDLKYLQLMLEKEINNNSNRTAKRMKYIYESLSQLEMLFSQCKINERGVIKKMIIKCIKTSYIFDDSRQKTSNRIGFLEGKKYEAFFDLYRNRDCVVAKDEEGENRIIATDKKGWEKDKWFQEHFIVVEK